MALQIVEFFGYAPLDSAGNQFMRDLQCPFVGSACIKPRHGACSVRQYSDSSEVICCPNRLYADNFRMLSEIAQETFGANAILVRPDDVSARVKRKEMSGREVAIFGRYWGRELPLPRPPGAGASSSRQYYVDWILAKLGIDGRVVELTAVEVQTIDTTGSYVEQADSFFAGERFVDSQIREPGFSNAGMNWENVNKRILPQIIYKGHVLRRESKCSKGLFFVCPKQVYDRIRQRLGGNLHEYQPGNGTISFRSYELGPPVSVGETRDIRFFDQFTTTVDQVALAFTSPMHLPEQGVYEAAINNALKS